MKAASAFLASGALLLAACAPVDYRTRVDLLGDPAPMAAASRTIVITPTTHAVNVTGGEVVRLVAGDKVFAWNFDGAIVINAFERNLAAPPGMLDHKVMAYVAPDPRYSGDGGGRSGQCGGHR